MQSEFRLRDIYASVESKVLLVLHTEWLVLHFRIKNLENTAPKKDCTSHHVQPTSDVSTLVSYSSRGDGKVLIQFDRRPQLISF